MARFTAVIATLILLTGCTKDNSFGEPDEYAIALRQIKDEQLVDCAGLPETPGTAVGDLLQDFNDMAKVAACNQLHYRTLRDYIRPLVDKARKAP